MQIFKTINDDDNTAICNLLMAKNRNVCIQGNIFNPLPALVRILNAAL